jgi:hypothetical protein
MKSHPTRKPMNGQQFLTSSLCWAQVMNLTTELCKIIAGSGTGNKFPSELLIFATNMDLTLQIGS